MLFNVGIIKQTSYTLCSNDQIELLRRVEDAKVVIRICKSEKNRQHNGQKKKDKRTNNDLQN